RNGPESPPGSTVQGEENPHAPYSEPGLALDLFLEAELDEVIVHRPRQPRLEPAAHMDIGNGHAACSVVSDANRVVGARFYGIIEIGAKGQNLVAPGASGFEPDSDEG